MLMHTHRLKIDQIMKWSKYFSLVLHYGGNNSETDAAYIIRKHRTIKLLRQIVGAVSFSFNFADAWVHTW